MTSVKICNISSQATNAPVLVMEDILRMEPNEPSQRISGTCKPIDDTTIDIPLMNEQEDNELNEHKSLGPDLGLKETDDEITKCNRQRTFKSRKCIYVLIAISIVLSVSAVVIGLINMNKEQCEETKYRNNRFHEKPKQTTAPKQEAQVYKSPGPKHKPIITEKPPVIPFAYAMYKTSTRPDDGGHAALWLVDPHIGGTIPYSSTKGAFILPQDGRFSIKTSLLIRSEFCRPSSSHFYASIRRGKDENIQTGALSFEENSEGASDTINIQSPDHLCYRKGDEIRLIMNTESCVAENKDVSKITIMYLGECF